MSKEFERQEDLDEDVPLTEEEIKEIEDEFGVVEED